MRRTPQVDLFLSQLSVGSVVVVSAAGIRQIELAGALYAQLTLQTELSPVPRSRQLARYLRRMRVKVGSGRAGRAVSLAQLIRDYAEISASSVPSHLRTRFESLHLQSLLPFCQVGDSDLDTGRHILTEFRRIRRRMRTIRSTRTLPPHR